MNALVRAVGFAALGAGMLHLALAIGSPTVPALVLATTGAVEFLWGVVVVARGRVLVPRLAVVVALVPAAGWLVLLLAGGATEPFTDALRVFPALIATALDLAVAIGIAALLRNPPDPQRAPNPFAVAVIALSIAAVTVPALIATEAGDRLGPPTLPTSPPHPGEPPH